MDGSKTFADYAVGGLIEQGYRYRSDHEHLAGHWYRREEGAIRVSQVSTTDFVHVTLTNETYDSARPDELLALGLTLHQPAN